MNTTLSFKNINAIAAGIKKVDVKRIAAARTSANVEGFRLSSVLKANVRSSKPVGKKLHPLSIIARYTATGKLKKNARKPLASLARFAQRKVIKSGDNYAVDVGFVSNTMASKQWPLLIKRVQTGGPGVGTPDFKKTRLKFAKIGAKLKKKGNPNYRFFFLSKKRSSSRILPEREIIEPFWQANRQRAAQNISKNFERKLMGLQI